MSFKQWFHTGEVTHDVLRNLKAHQLWRICQENIDYPTEQNKSRQKLYNIILAATPDIQDTIRELVLRTLQEGLPDECIDSWVKKRKLVTLDVDAWQFKKR